MAEQQRFRVVVLLRSHPGREAEFHEWYEDTHLDEVISTAGFTSAQRFSIGHQWGNSTPNDHVAIYSCPGESAKEVHDRLMASHDQRSQSDATDPSEVSIWVLEELGPEHR